MKLRLLVVAGLLLLAPLGCGRIGTLGRGPVEPAFREIVIDGDTAEWPARAAAYSDEHYVYVRFTLAAEQITLQSSPRTVALFLDIDGNPATGQVMNDPALGGLGVDMVLRFSPPAKNNSPGVGVDLHALDSQGNKTKLSVADYDIVFAPTYSSSWYELRICRTPGTSATAPPISLPTTGLLGPGKVTGVAGVLSSGAALPLIMACERFEVTTDVVCPGGRRLSDLAPPEKSANAVRIVSWNVLATGALQNPEPFARILRTLNPDVLLLQEWDQGDAQSVKQWLSKHVSGAPANGASTDIAWHVIKAPGTMANGGAVLIASKFPLTSHEGDRLTCSYKDDDGKTAVKPIRFVSATAQSPIGPILLGSTHFKSRGFKDSVEDRRRMAEAAAINKYISAGQFPAIRVIAGDINLVGSRPPLDLLRAQIDSDGSDLKPADALVLGDAAFYSWRDPSTPFTPGRLDWLVYSDSTVDANTAFVLDTDRLADPALTRLGLQRDDSRASDHLPVVVDLTAK